MPQPRPMALITGATRPGRVGFATALALARAGCDLLLTHRDTPEAARAALDALASLRQQLQHSVGPEAQFHTAPLDHEHPGHAFDQAHALAQRHPRLAVLVLNASIYEPTPTEALAPAQAERFFRVNALSPIMIARALAPSLAASPLPGGGSIVSLGDLHAMGPTGQPRARFIAYAMSKAALLEATLVLAKELAPRVRCNVVAPGVVAFPTQGHESDPASQQAYLRRVPLARPGTPEEAAQTIRWLALDATYITGQVIRLDGGRSIA